MNISYRLFDHEKDNVESLFELYKTTYGDDSHYRKRWKWEYDENPNKNDIKIIIAVSEGKIVGATTRMPFSIKNGETEIKTAFSVNSMVHPEFRRLGIMDNLYHKGAEFYDVLFSKGTKPGMYKLLVKMGYKSVKPDTFMTALIGPFRWLLWKFKFYRPKFKLSDISLEEWKDYYPVSRFDNDFDSFINRCKRERNWVEVSKNSHYMNWRYVDNPLKTYKIFYRKKNNEIVSTVILNNSGSTGKIVDFIWDVSDKDEPAKTILFVKHFFKRNRLLKVSCWSLNQSLRDMLQKKGFIERKEKIIMNLSIFSNNKEHEMLKDRKTFAFVEGDSDVEYLTE